MTDGVVARIRPMSLRGRAGISMRTPFDQAFLDSFKAMVPAGERYWQEHAHEWWVAETSADMATHLVRELFGFVEIIDEAGESTTHTPAGEKLRQGSLF